MNYRKDFPMLEKDIVYFDNGATTFKPNCVIDKMCDYYKNYSSNAHRGDYSLSLKASDDYFCFICYTFYNIFYCYFMITS